MEKVTLYIPTYNRNERLKKNLIDLFNIIENENLYSNIDILVGDNCSSDSTVKILNDFLIIAKAKKIKLNYFVNNSNLGFNENVRQGYLRFQGEYIIFLSDDDNLFPGALSAYLKLIFETRPSVGLVNFDQKPFTISSPLYNENEYFIDFQIEFFKPLLLFPKLTGIVLKNPDNQLLREEIASVVVPTFAAAHIALAIYQYSKLGKGLHTSVFFGYPDPDYLEHITFLPYVSNLSRIEVKSVLNKTGKINNQKIQDDILNLIPSRIVIDDSIYLLYQYYTLKTNLTKEAFSELWSNCLRYLLGKKASKSGLSLRDSSSKFKRMKIYMISLLVIKNQIFKLLGLSHAKLGEKNY